MISIHHSCNNCEDHHLPTILGNMMADLDRAGAKRVADTMLNMVKLDLGTLKWNTSH